MSKDGPEDLSDLDALFSRYGVGLSSGGQNLSAARKQQIYAGKAEEPVNPTQETLKALIDYEEAIPDQEVDDFVYKIRNAHLLDDYADETLDHSEGSPTISPSFNPWPLDEDNPSPIIMSDPLSGDILVTDLPNKQELKMQDTEEKGTDLVEDEEKGAVSSANDTLILSGDADGEGAVASSDDDKDEEAEDLTEEFKMERGGGDVTSDVRHGDGEQSNSNNDDLKDESNDWELIPRVDDDIDGESKDSMKEKPKNENGGDKEDEDDEDEEEEEEEEEEDTMDQTDSSGEALKGSRDLSSMEDSVIINVKTDPIIEPKDKDSQLDDTTEMDGQSSKRKSTEHAIPESPEKKSEDPGFEAFLAELGVSTLDLDAQKSRVRISRLGPMAQRRPITKRFSGEKDDEGQSKWMFVDSTVPKPKKPSIDEDEEERTSSREPPAQPSSMGRRPPGLGMGPMLLPGLGNAISSLKKTPTSSPNKTFHTTSDESKEPTKAAPLPHGSPRKVLPNVGKTPPKPASRPKPHPKPAQAQEPSQPAWMKELKQRSPKKTAEVKSVSELNAEKKKDGKDLNSDILHPAQSEKKEPEPQKTAPWMTNGRAKLPPINSPNSSSKGEAAPSIPQWKKDLKNKKKTPIPPPSSIQKSPAKPPVKPPKPTEKPVIAKKPAAKLPEKKRAEDATDGVNATSESKPAALKLTEKKVEDATDLASTMSPGTAKQPGKKAVDDITNGVSEMSDSKKIKLSFDEHGESPIAEEKMDVGSSDATSKEENGDAREGKDVGSEVREDERKDAKEEMVEVKEQEKDPEMGGQKEEEKKEEMNFKVEEKVDIIMGEKEDDRMEEKKEPVVSNSELKKVELDPAPKQDERKVTIIKKDKKDTENGDVKKENVDSSTVEKIKEKKEEVPMSNDKPKITEKKEEVPMSNDKPEIPENQKAAERPTEHDNKSVKIITKENNAKKDSNAGKVEEKKVTIIRKSDVVKPDVKKSEVKKPDAEKTGLRNSDSMNEDEKVVEGKSVTVLTKNSMNKEGPVLQKAKENEMEMNPDVSNMPKWKREALERKQKRKMSGGYAPLQKASNTIDTNMNTMPQWKKDLMEKRKMMPKVPSVDAVDREEKGSKENLKSEKVLKRHTLAADVSVNVPSGHKTGVPTWKQELEKRKNGRLAKHLENKDAGPEIQEKNAETVASASS